MVPAAFEDVHEAYQVGIDIGVWIFDGITHACLCGQIYHAIRFVLCKDIAHGIAILDINAKIGKMGLIQQAL